MCFCAFSFLVEKEKKQMETRRRTRATPSKEREPPQEEGEDVNPDDPSQDVLVKVPTRARPAKGEEEEEEEPVIPDDRPPGDLEAFFKMILSDFLLRFFADEWNASQVVVFTEQIGLARMTADEATRIGDFLDPMRVGYSIQGEFSGKKALVLGNMGRVARSKGGSAYVITIDFAEKGLRKRGQFLAVAEGMIAYLERNSEVLFPERTGQHENAGFRLWYAEQVGNIFLARLGYDALMRMKIVDRIYRKSDIEGQEVFSSFEEILARVESGEGVILGNSLTARKTLDEKRISIIRGAIKELVEDTVGQNAVKRQISQLIRQSMIGLSPLSDVPYNFAFYGPPGVGKTRIATILSKVFAALGVIPRPPESSYDELNRRTETFRRREIGNEQPEKPKASWIDPVDRPIVLTKKEDLVGAYTGWTEPLTLMKIGDALGRILFLDEAYRLGEEGGFGTDALNTLLAAMTENGKYLGVVIAGYEDKIDRYFFGMNPGFKSRFINIVSFDRYDPAELAVAFVRRLYGRDNPNRGFMILDTDKEFTLLNGFFSETEVYEAFAEENIRGIENLAQQVQLEIISKLTFDDVTTRLKTRKNLPIRIPLDTIRTAFKKMDFKPRPQFEKTPSLTIPQVRATGKQTGASTPAKKCVRCGMFEAKLYCEKCRAYAWCSEFCKAIDYSRHMHEHAQRAKYGTGSVTLK